MCELSDEEVIGLRDGLRAQPLPPVSPDFDARVLSALAARPASQRFWQQSLRPVALGALCSFAVSLSGLALFFALPPAPPARAVLTEPSERLARLAFPPQYFGGGEFEKGTR